MIRALIKIPIQVYRYVISPALPPSCRYYPSCSEYALSAIDAHGAARGSLFAVKRILRCHPFAPGGVDPVPAPDMNAQATTEGDRHFCRTRG